MIKFFELCTDEVLSLVTVIGGFVVVCLPSDCVDTSTKAIVSSWVSVVLAFYFKNSSEKIKNGGKK